MPSDASRDADAEEINSRRSERDWGGCKGTKHVFIAYAFFSGLGISWLVVMNLVKSELTLRRRPFHRGFTLVNLGKRSFRRYGRRPFGQG
jgi:hypothetical protein